MLWDLCVIIAGFVCYNCGIYVLYIGGTVCCSLGCVMLWDMCVMIVGFVCYIVDGLL